MSAVSSSHTAAYPPIPSERDPRHQLYTSIVGIFVLIGVAIVIGVGFLLLQGQVPNWSAAVAAWSWVVTVVLVILGIVIAISIVRLVVWGVRGEPYGRMHERHRHRYDYGESSPPAESAVEIARQRFARGEISEEQLDQILQKLDKGSTLTSSP